MKAILAYFQGKFNTCSGEWISATQYKLNLIDNANMLEGSFKAEYDEDLVMINFSADTGMKPIKAPKIPKPPDLPLTP